MAEQNKSSKTVHITDKDFDETVHKYPLIVVDFWADWCPPCKMLAPVIEQLAQDYAGKVVFGKLNVDENPETTSHFGVSSIPTLLLIKNGVVKDSIVGAVPRPQIEAKLKLLM
jgi:thioredoxin 1